MLPHPALFKAQKPVAVSTRPLVSPLPMPRITKTKEGKKIIRKSRKCKSHYSQNKRGVKDELRKLSSKKRMEKKLKTLDTMIKNNDNNPYSEPVLALVSRDEESRILFKWLVLHGDEKGCQLFDELLRRSSQNKSLRRKLHRIESKDES